KGLAAYLLRVLEVVSSCCDAEQRRPRDIKRRATRPERLASRAWNARAGRRSVSDGAAPDSEPALCRPLQSRVRGGSREVLVSLVPGRLAMDLVDGGGSVVAGRCWRLAKHVMTCGTRGQPRVRSWRREAGIRTPRRIESMVSMNEAIHEYLARGWSII